MNYKSMTNARISCMLQDLADLEEETDAAMVRRGVPTNSYAELLREAADRLFFAKDD